MKKWIFLCALLLLTAMPEPVPAQKAVATRTMSVPALTVHVWLTKNYASIPMLREFFSTDNHNTSVYCRSGFFDIQYVLRDSSGRIVTPSSKKAYVAGGDIPMLFGDSMQWGKNKMPFVRGHPDVCTVKTTSDERRVLLSDLYPGLRHGTYFLQMTLAPVERNDRASSAPI